MERLTEFSIYRNEKHLVCFNRCEYGYSCESCRKFADVVDRLAAYEDMMERWRLRDIAEAERIFRRVNALGGTDKMAECKRTVAGIIHCGDCKHRYPKDFEAFCSHRVGPCKLDGFCDRGEKREVKNSVDTPEKTL